MLDERFLDDVLEAVEELVTVEKQTLAKSAIYLGANASRTISRGGDFRHRRLLVSAAAIAEGIAVRAENLFAVVAPVVWNPALGRSLCLPPGFVQGPPKLGVILICHVLSPLFTVIFPLPGKGNEGRTHAKVASKST
jgi:hypothetical protein